MAYQIIDRRPNGGGKSAPNRQKLLKRVKGRIREAVKKAIRDGNVSDIVNSKGRKVNVPDKDLNEPSIGHGEGGITDHVHPGNKEFVQGDRVNRPEKGSGGSGKGEASPDGEGEDEFSFELTREEFLDIFFEDLELPEMLKKSIATVDEYENRRAGFATDGNPSRLNVERSMRQAKGRRNALRAPKKKKLKKLEEEKAQLEATINTAQANGQDCSIEKDRLKEVEKKIVVLKRKIKAVPFVDDMDLRYNRWERHPIPTTQAVMFCIMDVSGSMGEWEKEMSKRFFMLLYLFLFRAYERVEIVFIRHHTTAKEVDEEEFFYSRETGGTIVSSAIQLAGEIIQERFSPDDWNIYICQASDGDNWGDDNAKVTQMLSTNILPLVQYYAYIEINDTSRESDLWPAYSQLQEESEKFAIGKITDSKDIFPVLKGLFEKRD